MGAWSSFRQGSTSVYCLRTSAPNPYPIFLWPDPLRLGAEWPWTKMHTGICCRKLTTVSGRRRVTELTIKIQEQSPQGSFLFHQGPKTSIPVLMTSPIGRATYSSSLAMVQASYWLYETFIPWWFAKWSSYGMYPMPLSMALQDRATLKRDWNIKDILSSFLPTACSGSH